MPAEVTFLSALLVGFLGSTHCIGMCGGIAGAAGMASAVNASSVTTGRILHLLLYNTGRILSYVTAGFIAATIGRIGLGSFSDAVAHDIAMAVSILFLLGLGAYLAGWWSFLPLLERAGGVLWRALAPIGRRFLPVRYGHQAFMLGVVWGWLPCGLVYSALAWSAAAAEPWRGALIMAGFGLGTLPTLLCLGVAGQVLQQLRHNPLLRQAAGLSLIVLATVLFGLNLLDPHTGEQPHNHVGTPAGAVSQILLPHGSPSHCRHPSVFCAQAPLDHRTVLT